MDPAFNGYSKEVVEKIKELRNGGVIIIDNPYTADDFSQFGLKRDVFLPENIAYTHRSGKEGEIYFLSNQEERARTFSASFRDRNAGKAYIYDAVSNSLAPAEINNDGEISISLHACGSCFVLFPNNDIESILSCLPHKVENAAACARENGSACGKGNNLADAKKKAKSGKNVEISLAGPYSLLLKENNISLTVDSLADWSKNDDNKVKFFSGHGVYTTEVKVEKPQGNEVLHLGDVHNIAHVWVNGIDCGIVWTAPYEVKIGHALQKGKNKVEIEVVNTWANAIRGNDLGTPPYEGIWTNARYRRPNNDLLPAGLLGPVVIK